MGEARSGYNAHVQGHCAPGGRQSRNHRSCPPHSRPRATGHRPPREGGPRAERVPTPCHCGGIGRGRAPRSGFVMSSGPNPFRQQIQSSRRDGGSPPRRRTIRADMFVGVVLSSTQESLAGYYGGANASDVPRSAGGGWQMFAPGGYRYTSTRRKDIDAGITLVVVDTLTMQLEWARDGYSNALTGSGRSRWASGR